MSAFDKLNAFSIAVLSALILLPSARTRADETWVVVDVSTSAAPELPRLEQVAQSIVGQGQALISNQNAAAVFEAKHSTAASHVDDAELAEIDDKLRQLTRYLAVDDVARAVPLLTDLARLPDGKRDFLNRNAQRARLRFQTCLLAGHLLFSRVDPNEGLQYVRTCAADFPGFQPERGRFLAPSFREFLQRALDDSDRGESRTLRVDVPSDATEGCRVRLNGLEEGPPPAIIRGLHGDHVRVQVECGGVSGRVHNVALQPGENSIRIDSAFDRVVQTAPHLGLRYPHDSEGQIRAIDHAVAIAEVVGASRVLQVQSAELVDVSVRERRVISRASLTGSSVEAAVARLLGGQSEAATSPRVSGVAERSNTMQVLAWTSVGAAVVATATAIVAWRIEADSIHAFNANPSCVAGVTEAYLTCQSLADKVVLARDIKVGGIIAGVGFGVAAIVFFVLDQTAERRPARRNPIISRACEPGPGDVGVSCRIRF